jgi:uncharacterized membrane protein
MKGERLRTYVELAAEPEEVFDLWLKFERLPEILEGVRRVKRVGDRRVLWDVDIAGRQLVWEAEITDVQPGKRIAWESRWGTPNRGELHFERTAPGRTRIDVDIVYEPRGLLERMGAQLGLVRRSVEGDLLRFARFVRQVVDSERLRRVR